MADSLQVAVLEQAVRLLDLAAECSTQGEQALYNRDTQVYVKLELGARRQFLACAKTLGLRTPNGGWK